MKTRRFLPLAAVLCLVAATATAQVTVQERSPFSVGVGIGWAGLNMSDINDVIDEVNAEAGEEILSSINSGVDFDVVLGYRVSPTFNLGLVYTRIDASSSYPNPTGAMELQVPANFFGAFGQYVYDMPGKVTYGLGVELGSLATTGKWDIALPAVGVESGAFDGSTFAGTAYLLLDYVASSTLSLQFQAGYRFGKITDLKFDGSPADATLDYRGGLLRAMFLIHP